MKGTWPIKADTGVLLKATDDEPAKMPGRYESHAGFSDTRQMPSVLTAGVGAVHQQHAESPSAHNTTWSSLHHTGTTTAYTAKHCHMCRACSCWCLTRRAQHAKWEQQLTSCSMHRIEFMTRPNTRHHQKQTMQLAQPRTPLPALVRTKATFPCTTLPQYTHRQLHH